MQQLVFLTVLPLLASAKIFSFGGSLPDPPLQPNFDLNAYTGKWYEIYRTTFMLWESPTATDISAVYNVNSDGSVSVYNSMYEPQTKEWKSVSGTAKVLGNALLSVKFSKLAPEGDYRVLYTDYQTISVVYSKASMFGASAQFGWILARSPNVSQTEINRAFQYFSKHTNLDIREEFQRTRHGIAPAQDS